MPLDFELKQEWNTWPTRFFLRRVWARFFKCVSCKKAMFVPNFLRWANIFPRFTAPFRPLQFHVVDCTKLSLFVSFKLAIIWIGRKEKQSTEHECWQTYIFQKIQKKTRETENPERTNPLPLSTFPQLKGREEKLKQVTKHSLSKTRPVKLQWAQTGSQLLIVEHKTLKPNIYIK